MDKSQLMNAGISDKTYNKILEFTATTQVTSGFDYPYILLSHTVGLDKTHRYKVVVNNVEHILPCEMWADKDDHLKCYEYLGNIALRHNDADSGFYPVRNELSFLLTQDANDDGKWELSTTTAGSYNIAIYREDIEVQTIPNEAIWGQSYSPLKLKSNGGSTFCGISLGGTNHCSNPRGGIAIGNWNQVEKDFAIGIGLGNVASGHGSIAMGDMSATSADYSIAIGRYSETNGRNSVAIGCSYGITQPDKSIVQYPCKTDGGSSFAAGCGAVASGSGSMALGFGVATKSSMQTALGAFNIEDPDGKYLLIVGNTKSPKVARSNAHTLDWSGNAWYQGTVECTGVILSSPNGTKYKLTVNDDGSLTTTKVV